MLPNDYSEYSKVFDYFSDPALFPGLKSFITDIVVPRLPPQALVVNIGAGTGLFDLELLIHAPTTQLTLIEPSPDMMPIAQKRLGNRAQYCYQTIDQALPTLSKQDVCIFQRSLYAIYKNEWHCKQLFCQLYEKLNPNGQIFISEFTKKIDVQDMRTHAERIKEKTEFLAYWPSFEHACKIFNAGIDKGIFHLFTSAELDSILKSTGFTKLLETENFFHVYRKLI